MNTSVKRLLSIIEIPQNESDTYALSLLNDAAELTAAYKQGRRHRTLVCLPTPDVCSVHFLSSVTY